jgi:uncharacterized protein (DUF2267 family)
MSATGVTSLDHSVHETNVWLRDVQEEIHLETRQEAYNALRAVLHTLRDRLPSEVAIKLAAQLPLLLRGIYYEGWHAAGTPTQGAPYRRFHRPRMVGAAKAVSC